MASAARIPVTKKTTDWAQQQFARYRPRHCPFSFPDNLKLALNYVHVALFVLLPVTGWVAESWLGRYRAIAVGLVLSFASILAAQATFIMLQFDWTPIPAFVLMVVGLVIGTFGFGFSEHFLSLAAVSMCVQLCV